MSASPARKRYNRRVLWCSAAYAATLLAATFGFKHHLVDGLTAWFAALLPALAIVALFVVMGRYLIEESDEYLRLLMTRQVLWGSGFALTIATIWGFLESFGLVGHVESYAVAILWFAGLGLGGLANRFTERG